METLSSILKSALLDTVVFCLDQETVRLLEYFFCLEREPGGDYKCNSILFNIGPICSGHCGKWLILFFFLLWMVQQNN